MTKQISTFERLMKDPKRKKRFDEGYKEFLISELLLALMEEDDISVRKLAKAANVSPKLIQDIRSGKDRNITLKSFFKIIDSFGYQVLLKKEDKSIPLVLQK